MYVICLSTEHGIVLDQTEQFNVLDLYTHSRCMIVCFILGQLMEK